MPYKELKAKESIQLIQKSANNKEQAANLSCIIYTPIVDNDNFVRKRGIQFL